MRRHTGFDLIPCEHIGGDAALARILGALDSAFHDGAASTKCIGIDYEWSRYTLPLTDNGDGSPNINIDTPRSVLVRTRVGGRWDGLACIFPLPLAAKRAPAHPALA